jgi:hypothetical protein
VEVKQASSRQDSGPPCRRVVWAAVDERGAPGESVVDTRTLGVLDASRLPLEDAGPKHRPGAEARGLGGVRDLHGAEDTKSLAPLLVVAVITSIENELVRDRHHVSACYGARLEHGLALVYNADVRKDPLVHRAICESYKKIRQTISLGRWNIIQ